MKPNFMQYTMFFMLIFSCTKKNNNSENISTEKKFDMYEMSEMALLMEQMYVDNEILKTKILKGESIGKFPQHFLKIHQAVMTEKQIKDVFFKTHANKFVAAQEKIYTDSKNAKQHFNKSIDACIKCHETKCGGPIDRIKKLYIK